MIRERTYEIVKGPSAMEWEEYSTKLVKEWNELINSERSKSEKAIQTFLEFHPCLLPGPFGVKLPSGHYPFPGAVISQPPLKGLITKVPDFMWLGMDSCTFYPVLIEIETPHKKWFNKDGTPNGNFTQAHDQLASWKVWFNKPLNQSLFLEYYQIPYRLRSFCLEPEYVLIYGNREEIKNNPINNSKRKQMAGNNESLMTFDRLRPNYDAKDLFTVKKNDNGYTAISFPPTYTIKPDSISQEFSLIKDKDRAISNSQWMTEERKAFLGKRIPVWESWVERDDRGWVHIGDYE